MVRIDCWNIGFVTAAGGEERDKAGGRGQGRGRVARRAAAARLRTDVCAATASADRAGNATTT